ncbi:MAG: uracil-DNA glycosylase [Candidatus Liptonbacteria bacterium]|nr:uracil-DNA glycosylase [Candidatus Liptonbacteria bacterium]
MDKFSELKKLEQEIADDNTLPLREANLVFGEGNPESEVVFIGEAPGFNEDQQKRPFVGRAGQLLRQNIRDIKWKEADVYITNIVKRRPPENRDPMPNEIESYKPYLTRQLEIIKPKIVVALGRFSMNYFLPEARITGDHGKIFRFDSSTSLTTSGFLLYPIYHPAAALRSTQMKEEFEKNFRKLPRILEKADELLAEKKTEEKTTGPSGAEQTSSQKQEKSKQEKLF